jgi:hypothetical protein
MPTLNPRINVTLSPSLDSLVGRLASLERVSKSMVLRELLEAAEPSLVHAVALMEAALGAGANARKNLVRDLESGIKAAEGTSELMLQNMALQTRDLVSEAQAVKGRRPARGRRGAPPVTGSAPRPAGRPVSSSLGPKRPPSSNRGVKS